MILKKLKKSICIVTASFLAVTSMPIMANEWKPVSEENTISSSETEKYYHLGMGYHVTWQRSNGQWTDGAPGSTQSATINLSNSEVESLANNIPGLVGKKIKNVSVQLYSLEHHQTKQNPLPKWEDKKFGYWPTVQNGGRDTNGTVTWKGDYKLFFKNYNEYFAQNIRLDNNSISYNEKTGALTYKYSYMLSTPQTLATTKLGFPIHTKFRAYRQILGFSQSVSKTTADVESYLGTKNMDITFDVLENNPKTSATFYILPLLYVFEAEADEPGVTITAPPQDKMIICDPKSNSGPIQLLVNRARASWQKTTGKIIFTDATGKNKDFRIEKEIPASAYNNNFLKMTWCIPYNTDRLLVTFIPDPSKADETYVSEYERNQNDLGIGNITLQNNNKNVSTPTPNANHTTKIELVNLGDKVVGKPTIDITVTEVGKTEPFYKDTVTVDTDLKGNATVTIPSNTFKPTSNKIEVCGVVNQTHTDKNDNIKNDNDKKCQKFEGVQDMALSKNVSLLNKEGKEVPEIVQGENMTIVFRPKNIAGSQPVGLDSKTNPLATLEVKVTDNKTGNVIYSGGYVKATEVIQPGGLVEVEVENVKIPANTLEIKACATIKDIHDTLGFNIRNNEHDTVCKVFGTTKNYAVKDLVLDKTRVEASGKKVPVVFKFTVANEAPGDKESFPEIIIEQVGKGKIWSSSSIAIQAGKEKTISVPIVLNPLPAGNATFKVTVNPNKTETEYKTGVSDPYKDNSKSTAITAYATPACVGCSAKNTSNNWVEELPFSRVIYNKYLAHVGHNKNGDCIYEWVCSKPETVSGTKKVSYFEKYYIDSIKVKTKWSEDNASKYSHIDNKTGWATVYSTNSPTVKTIKVKAGSYIELETTTKYETDRDKKVSAPENVANAKGECSTGPIEEPQTPSPSVFADHTYAKMQTESNCIVLATDLRSDPLGGYNYKAMRNFPERKDLSGSGLKQRIYIPQGTKVGTYTLTINTEIAQGINKPYKVSGTDKKLQDCVTINIEVVSNNDIVTGIIQ